MNNEMKGAKPTLAERLYEMSKEDSVYCTLEKYDNPDDAFRAMAGSYEGGTFAVLDDETFPKFVFGNVIDLLYIQEIGGMTEEEIDYIVNAVPEVVAYLRDISPVWEDLVKGDKDYVIQ